MDSVVSAECGVRRCGLKQIIEKTDFKLFSGLKDKKKLMCAF
jgi:hypothetical protein